jgi:hypothetical protein
MDWRWVSSGRAPAFQAGSTEFKPWSLTKKKKKKKEYIVCLARWPTLHSIIGRKTKDPMNWIITVG